MGLGMGHEWFKNQNANAYYRFLGVNYVAWVCAWVGQTQLT